MKTPSRSTSPAVSAARPKQRRALPRWILVFTGSPEGKIGAVIVLVCALVAVIGEPPVGPLVAGAAQLPARRLVRLHDPDQPEAADRRERSHDLHRVLLSELGLAQEETGCRIPYGAHTPALPALRSAEEM